VIGGDDILRMTSPAPVPAPIAVCLVVLVLARPQTRHTKQPGLLFTLDVPVRAASDFAFVAMLGVRGAGALVSL